MVEFFKNLSNDYLELLNDNEDFNKTVFILRNELTNTNPDINNIKTINLNHVSIKQFEIIIKYIYGGIFSLDGLDVSFIFEIMLVAYEFFLEELGKFLETFLIEKKASWLRLHFAHIYKSCFQKNKAKRLQNWCKDIVVINPEKVLDSEDFVSIPENALISLIERDDLKMDEIKIWNYIIKWGIAKNPGLSSNLKEWSPENFMTLKITLQNCLPHIRYFQISADDIINNVKPYKQILEKIYGPI
ncbi:hypothetical protein C2G38_2246739 [Gigaspora rosea]|uniref:BACK domain-containing protein n=1 Tax=Gigaspora rosea TaxID=44941 RepID=A0A397VA93_9GLOM|nr:hypothetical protein C2G38_2246739 [Gigaspora rosea]